MADTIAAAAVARFRAEREAAGLPPTCTNPAVWRIVVSVMADAPNSPASGRRLPSNGRNGSGRMPMAANGVRPLAG